MVAAITMWTPLGAAQTLHGYLPNTHTNTHTPHTLLLATNLFIATEVPLKSESLVL